MCLPGRWDSESSYDSFLGHYTGDPLFSTCSRLGVIPLPRLIFLTCSGIVGGLSENGCFKRPQVCRLQQNCVSALQRAQLCSVPLSSGVPERFEFCPSGFILHRIESLVKTLSHARQRLRSSGRGSLFQQAATNFRHLTRGSRTKLSFYKLFVLWVTQYFWELICHIFGSCNTWQFEVFSF